LIPAIIDQVREVVQGTEGNQEWARRSASLRNQPTRPQQGNHQSRFAGARDANLNRINNDPRFAAPARQVPVTPDSRRDPEFRSSGDWVGDPNAGRPQPTRSPAIGAPVHARPAAFGAAQGGLGGSADAPGSVYTPQVPQRPSTPAQAVQSNPYAGIGDVRGQELPQTNIQQDAQPSAGTQEYGGQKLQGIDQNGVDMERRRAFLDANNSLDGMTAVRELLKRRKLSISVSD
jgi:hypothetical protein